MIEADSVHSTPRLSSSPNNVIDLSAARAVAPPPVALPPSNVAEVTALPVAPQSEEELDRQSQIMRAAVTYTALNGSLNGAWIAEHTGNSTVAEIVNEGVFERKDATLRKLTRLMRKAEAVRTVEIWSLASVAKVVMNQNGDGESGRNLQDFEVLFLQSLFELIERNCRYQERSA
ncbi:hypothetical protein I3J27_18335 [Bradyrhizobium xenonodulans]|uniref:Uncharacterized protein n=1 Tax=Bradyrhizobium xenonodulans TaxID=2736875 RepID=A0ABY7MWJ0_9BRAD|nr:hypothetical protein [Bradyrhizobium xenonodulans]WBL82291.1 hypothetical protein I3J27_18335 [Bradyrhizobium xenonodulans]